MAECVANGVRSVIVQMVAASIHQRPRAQLSTARSISERQHVTRSIAWIDKRSRLVSAAVGLAYQNGFGATSLADIAREAEVPLGNVYYYFKTKDEIGEAIVELRLAQLSAQRQRWDEAGSPKDRLCACVQGVFENKDFLAQRGCAVGTFCSELHKGGGAVATRATEIFAQHLAWIESQFRALGKGKDSSGLAVHLLSAMQGASVLAHTFHDPDLVATETKRLKSWIRSL